MFYFIGKPSETQGDVCENQLFKDAQTKWKQCHLLMTYVFHIQWLSDYFRFSSFSGRKVLFICVTYKLHQTTYCFFPRTKSTFPLTLLWLWQVNVRNVNENKSNFHENKLLRSFETNLYFSKCQNFKFQNSNFILPMEMALFLAVFMS